MALFGNTISLLHQALDLRLTRHQLLAANLANAETPGYRAVDLSFEQALRGALGQGGLRLVGTHPRHLGMALPGAAPVPPQVIESTAEPGADGNSVDAEGEMVKLAENGIMYSAGAQLVSRTLGMLRYAIEEGRR